MTKAQMFRSMSTVWALWAIAIWAGWVPATANHPAAYEPLFQVLMAILSRQIARDYDQAKS